MILIILDGWGMSKKCYGNAIDMAQTPTFDRLMTDHPNTQLIASGEAIDLPPGHMGNSEVGHQNIGAGRVVPQASTIISNAIEDGSFFNDGTLLSREIQNAVKRNATVHLFGLLSDGLVHSHIKHAFALLKLVSDHNADCVVHPLLDGRDVPPMSAKNYLSCLTELMNNLNTGRIGTLTGRVLYERDHKKWHHTEGLYNLLVHNIGTKAQSPIAAVEHAYSQGVTIDEHIPPYVMVDDSDEPVSKMKDDDLFINWNFRGDRATMISHALVDLGFTYFDRAKHPKIRYVCMSLYDLDISAPVAFPPPKLKGVLSEILAEYGFRQFKTAETTKFYHLTFFFNCRRIKPFKLEDQQMVPSKKNDKYDEIPEMSAAEVADSIISAINTQNYAFLAVNFANPDMVGHTGNLEAAIKAVEVVDNNLARVISAGKEQDYSIIVTADHGNADCMVDLETKKPMTAHTASNVPFILILNDFHKKQVPNLKLRNDGVLGNIAPTILKLFNIPKPAEMTCKSLIIEY
jgi:2,3-bisphosphoglycerate-independent phosphoglycerate mutase